MGDNIFITADYFSQFCRPTLDIYLGREASNRCDTLKVLQYIHTLTQININSIKH